MRSATSIFFEFRGDQLSHVKKFGAKKFVATSSRMKSNDGSRGGEAELVPVIVGKGLYCWFSHDVTKIQTTKLLILLIFYCRDV